MCTSKGIDGDEDGADVCIDLAVCLSLLEVVVDAFVGYRREERHIRDANLLLLEAVSLCGVWI